MLDDVKADPIELARLLSRQLLDQCGYQVISLKRVPLLALARYLGVTVTFSQQRVRGSLWAIDEDQPDLFTNYLAKIRQEGLASRFTLAHELGHRAGRLYLNASQTSLWKSSEWKIFVDTFAGNVLLPDDLLLLSLRHLSAPFHLHDLVKLSCLLGASISCLLVRMRQLLATVTIEFDQVIILATAALSRRSLKDYGPRVLISLSPIGSFIPHNTRLASLGSTSLAGIFSSAPPFVEGTVEDDMRIWESSTRCARYIKLTFKYVVFLASNQDRLLLSVSHRLHG